MKVCIIASECSPFAQSGSLGKMIYEKAVASANSGNETIVILPMYKIIKDNYESQFIGSSDVKINNIPKYVGLSKINLDKVDFYFIDNEEYFYFEKLYEFHNDGERFTYFCDASLKSLKIANFYPDYIIHDDWQTGLIPYLLNSKYKYQTEYTKIKTFFNIDTTAYQGIFPKEMEQIIDAPNSPILYLNDKINFMKSAIMEANIVTTVSKTYHDDLLESSINNRLYYCLKDKKQDFKGILQGIDYRKYDSNNDPLIYYNFDIKEIIIGKEKNKKQFKKEFNLENRDCMLVTYFNDLNDPIATQIIKEILPYLLDETDIQLCILGKGNNEFDEYINSLQNNFSHKLRYYSIDEDIKHKVLISSDLVLLPSDYEPFNQTELEAMHYGCIPLIHEEGGLKDTVMAYNEYTGEGNGFSFIEQSAEVFIKAFNLAYGLYRFNQKEWYKLIQRCSKEELSWSNYLKQIEKIYNSI